MAIKLSGMISGMDTDAMIDELVKAYSVRKDSYVKEQKSLEYKQDAWKEMNSKIYSLFSGKLSAMRFSTNYAMKSIKTSNSNKVTVSGSSNAVNGTQELKIESLAKSGYLTGGVVATESGDDLKASSKLSELGVSAGRLSITVAGEESYIDVTGDMTVQGFVNQLKEKGLNASFDEANQRFFISAKNSGAANDFSISGADATGTDVLKNMGLYSVSTADVESYKNYVAAADADASYMTNLAKDEYLKNLINSHVKTLSDERSTYATKVNELNSKIAEEEDKKTFAALTDKEKTDKITELSDKIQALRDKITDENAKGDEADSAAIDGYNEEIAKLEAKVTLYEEIKTEVGSSDAGDFKDKLNTYNESVDANIETYREELEEPAAKVKEFDEAITKAQGYLSATLEDKEQFLADNSVTVDYTSEAYNEVYTKYSDKYDYAKEMVAAYEEYESLVEAGSTDETRLAELREKLGLSQSETGASRIAGADAKIYLNGAMFESNSNNFQINGLTITAHAVTDDDEVITVTTDTDVDGIYNMVKDFFKEYNEVMKGMQESYNAASAGDYEPLTEEEMESMTDKQIEKWEKKLTTAALRKDSSLSSIMSLMKTAMVQSFEVNGETLNLASFGIKSAGYFEVDSNERNLYHIDGDADDKLVSGNADKLKTAIANDPDRFVEFFSKLTDNLYTQLNKKMSSSSLSSAYTVYNDKYMKQQYERYDDKISDWEDKVDAIREKYEKQFAAMETALSSLQSQSSYFSQMLGY